MNSPQRGYAPVVLPPVAEQVLAPFRELSPAGVAAPVSGRLRTLRLRMSWTADDDWLFRPLPPDVTPTGRRQGADLSGLLRWALSSPWLGIDDDWLIDLHRVRTVAPAHTAVRIRVPGPRPSPCTFKLVAVVDSRGGGVTRSQLFGPSRPGPLADLTLSRGQGILIDRRTVTDDAHALQATPEAPALVDLLCATVSRTPALAPPTPA